MNKKEQASEAQESVFKDMYYSMFRYVADSVEWFKTIGKVSDSMMLAASISQIDELQKIVHNLCSTIHSITIEQQNKLILAQKTAEENYLSLFDEQLDEGESESEERKATRLLCPITKVFTWIMMWLCNRIR